MDQVQTDRISGKSPAYVSGDTAPLLYQEARTGKVKTIEMIVFADNLRTPYFPDKITMFKMSCRKNQ